MSTKILLDFASIIL